MKQNWPVHVKAVTARFFTILMLSVLSMTSVAGAQGSGREISGRVLDTEGEPLIGATVMLKDGAKVLNGVLTDVDGGFRLKAKPGNQLEVTYIGYVSATINATIKG